MIGKRVTDSAVGQNAGSAKAVPRPAAPSSKVKANASTPKELETKEPVKTIVKYITKQIYICPTQPVLTIERLPHLEYHVNELTKSIGRRPRFYIQGKSVQFVPESSEEYGKIQRYLGQLEVEEGITIFSRSLPPGSGLKVNVVERVVKVVKALEDLKELK